MADHHVDDHDECDVLTCGVKRELTGLAHGVGTLREDCDYFRQAYSRKLIDERRALEAADAATARATAAERERDDLIRQRNYEWDRRKKAQAARAAAESALAEAKRDAAQARAANLENSLALAEARGFIARLGFGPDAALARAGEQETRAQDADFDDAVTDALNAAAPAGEPASSGQEVRALAQIKELLEALPAPTSNLLARIYEIARDGAATPPPGEQGKGGGEGRGIVVDAAGKHAVCIDKTDPFHGWVMWRHPDGQWVSERKATPEEMSLATAHASFFFRWPASGACDPSVTIARPPLAPAQPAEHPASGGEE